MTNPLDTLYKYWHECHGYLRDILLVVVAVMCTNSTTEIANVVTEKLRRPIIKVLHQRSVMPFALTLVARILYALFLQRDCSDTMSICRPTMRSNARGTRVSLALNVIIKIIAGNSLFLFLCVRLFIFLPVSRENTKSNWSRRENTIYCVSIGYDCAQREDSFPSKSIIVI